VTPQDAVDAILDAGVVPEQVVAAAASLSRHGARLAVQRLEGVSGRFRQPHAWRVIECAHELHEAGWPAGCWLDTRIDAIADAAGLDRGVLQAWTHASPTSDDGTGVWAARVVAAIDQRDRLYGLAAEAQRLLGTDDLALLVEAMHAA
jgi:hypothetical protein